MANFQYVAPNGHIVEAIQFKAEDQDLTRAWPRWFIDLLIDGKVERNTHEKKWYLNRTRVINDGDWIILYPDDPKVGLIPDNLFIQVFRPAAT